MGKLPLETRDKLRKLLEKRTEKELEDFEIVEAYENLMAFGFAMMDLTENKNLDSKPVFN